MVATSLGVQLARMLAARGVRHVFGIPGVHNIELYRGLEDAGITHVLARHEQGAGFMADGYARATGRAGVALVISGPGLTNILTPLGQAYSDSVAVLAISTVLDDTAHRRGQLHQMRDQEGAARAVCDWSETARSPEAAFGLIERAFGEFSSRRARPRHLSLPIGLLGQAAPPPPAPRAPLRHPAVAARDLSKAREVLAQARRPLFVFGGGAVAGAEAARRLCRHLGAASFTTYAGRGVIGAQDPLHFGALLARDGAAAAIASADAVIAVGTELAEVDLWRDHLGHAAPMLRVDIDPQVLTDPVRADWPVLADAGAFLAALGDAVAGEPARESGWSAAEVAGFRARAIAEIDAVRPGIVALCDVLAPALPDALMVYSDMTQFAYVAKEVWPMTRPGHWHHPFGFGTLGYALPAAIGGKIGRPELPVLAIAGDYGLQFTLGELAVAVELGLGLPVLVWDNDALKEIGDSMTRAQIAPDVTRARNPDFMQLAHAYGARATTPGSAGELVTAIRDGFGAPGPTLIRVRPGIDL